MPSYTIHLAIAKKYLEKHPEDNPEAFTEGVIAPDLLKKPESHYGPASSIPDLALFKNKIGIESSYNKGYYLHLLTDKLFYDEFLNSFSKEIYNDYDKLNKTIIEKYKPKLPEKILPFINHQNGDPLILEINDTYAFIESVAIIGIQDYKKGDLCRLIAKKYINESNNAHYNGNASPVSSLSRTKKAAEWLEKAIKKGNKEAVSELELLYTK